ncbi:MAG: hypothetical protein LIP06_11095 [Tannerellaceae bacterium]|nr:hypothetical protein [Tannerellaceae bacterium]
MKQINPLNPASYTSIDSLTFIFDIGASGQVSWFTDGVGNQRNVNGNIEYIAMQFPIHKRIAMSIGILPYSYVGYTYGLAEETGSTIYTNSFTGNGGLNDLYGGLSIELWKKRLSVGANFGYLFGNITHTNYLNFNYLTSAYGGVQEQSVEIRDLKMDFGIQYTHPLSRTESFTIGIAYTPSNKLNATSYMYETLSNSVLETDTITDQAFDLPNSFGAGISYTKENKLTLAADVLYEDWSNARFFDSKDEFKNRIRIAAGTEYIPNFQHRSLIKRMRYRAGFHYSNSYLKIKDSSYNEYGASVGFGIPLLDNRSLINISFEYVKVKPDNRPLLDEQYFRFTLNYTFNERWFFKFKVD